VREHVRECAECSVALDELAAVSADLYRLPCAHGAQARTCWPAPKARMAAELAAQAGLRQARPHVLALVRACFAWLWPPWPPSLPFFSPAAPGLAGVAGIDHRPRVHGGQGGARCLFRVPPPFERSIL